MKEGQRFRVCALDLLLLERLLVNHEEVETATKSKARSL